MTEDFSKYGIYDTKDNCWIGDSSGPRLFTHEDSEKANGMPQYVMARIAAQMAEVQMGYDLGRLRAREFTERDLKLKDEVSTKMGPLEALDKLERGT